MKTIRRSVFETNSSSTHSITIVSKKDYENWEKENLFINTDSWASLSENKNKTFVTKEEAIEILTNSKYPPDEDLNSLNEEDFLEVLRDNGFKTKERYDDEMEYEKFEKEYTSESGDIIVAFGYYGHD